MNTDTLRLHHRQFGLSGEDEYLNVGERVPPVALTEMEDAASRKPNHIGRTEGVADRQIR